MNNIDGPTASTNLAPQLAPETISDICNPINCYRTFSNAFNYGIIPKPISLSHIADFFEISIEYLLGETDDAYFEKAKVPSDFHTRLEKLRGTTSYYEIAKTCDFDKSMCSKWKTKKHIPSLDILRDLAKHFNVSMDYLLGRQMTAPPMTI